MKPALVPKPTSAAIATSVCAAPPAASAEAADRAVAGESTSSAIHTPAPPRCVIARYAKTPDGPRVPAGEQDRGRRHERHQLPEAKERDHVAGTHEPRQREQEGTRGERERTALPVRLQFVAREQRRRRADSGDEYQEEAAEPVDAERRVQPAGNPAPTSCPDASTHTPAAPSSDTPIDCTVSPARGARLDASTEDANTDRQHAGEGQRSGCLHQLYSRPVDDAQCSRT